MYTFEIQTPAAKLKRYDSGSDWGVERKLLATCNDKALIWWPGHTTWIHRGHSDHVPGVLQVAGVRARTGDLGQLLDSGDVGETRLSKLLKHPDAIAWIRKHFLDDDSLFVELRQNRTLTIKPKE